MRRAEKTEDIFSCLCDNRDQVLRLLFLVSVQLVRFETWKCANRMETRLCFKSLLGLGTQAVAV